MMERKSIQRGALNTKDHHCPRCGAGPGQPCVDDDGGTIEHYHQGRVYNAALESVRVKSREVSK